MKKETFKALRSEYRRRLREIPSDAGGYPLWGSLEWLRENTSEVILRCGNEPDKLAFRQQSAARGLPHYGLTWGHEAEEHIRGSA